MSQLPSVGRPAVIERRLMAASPMREIATVRTVGVGVFKKPVSTAGIASGWVAETAARPETDPATLALLEFPAADLYARPAATPQEVRANAAQRQAALEKRKADLKPYDEAILAGTDHARRPAWLDAWRAWPAVPAVAAGNLYVVDAMLLHRPGPRFLDGVEQICATLDRARAALANSGPDR